MAAVSGIVEAGFGLLLRAHKEIYVRSGGLLGHRMLGAPSLLLRTTGRKTGAVRTVGLTYARSGQSYVVTASNGGSDRAPAWLRNLEADPQVEIQVGRRRSPATARVVRRGEGGFDDLWRLVNRTSLGLYDRYQARTRREIPIVLCTPLPEAGRA